ncbi:MAG: NINE protein [Planctomycetes bacterium]|nr:NINE protein [Planctomycetota bacterium]
MEKELKCVSCGEYMAVDDSMAGEAVACPSCGNHYSVRKDVDEDLYLERKSSGRDARKARRVGGGGGTAESERSWLVALLLVLLVPGLGVHRFYTGHIGLGIIYLITCGGLGIWWIIDIILIATGSYTDVDGKPLRRDGF